MRQDVNFSTPQLKAYMAEDFAKGKDFTPIFRGPLVRREQGQLQLSEPFLDHMDQNDSNLVIHYELVAGVFDNMKQRGTDDVSRDHWRHLHAALMWWGFYRRDRVTEEDFAESMRVTARTVRRWLRNALAHVERQLKSEEPADLIVFPASYTPLASLAM